MNPAEVLDRIKKVHNQATDVKLAAFLGVDRTTVATWRSRSTMNVKIIVEKCQQDDLNYIFYGRSFAESQEAQHGDTASEDQATIIKRLTLENERLKGEIAALERVVKMRQEDESIRGKRRRPSN